MQVENQVTPALKDAFVTVLHTALLSTGADRTAAMLAHGAVTNTGMRTRFAANSVVKHMQPDLQSATITAVMQWATQAALIRSCSIAECAEKYGHNARFEGSIIEISRPKLAEIVAAKIATPMVRADFAYSAYAGETGLAGTMTEADQTATTNSFREQIARKKAVDDADNARRRGEAVDYSAAHAAKQKELNDTNLRALAAPMNQSASA